MGVAEVVLHDHDEILCFIALRGVVQTELLVLQQVMVVRQKYRTVVHFQCPFTFILEVTYRIECIGKIALLLHFTADFHGLPLCHIVRDRHSFHHKQVALLYVHIVSSQDAKSPAARTAMQTATALKIDLPLLLLLFIIFIILSDFKFVVILFVYPLLQILVQVLAAFV